MIIFGTRGITTSPVKGDFHCPNCADQQPFRQRKVRKFFHLYFIPIIPLGTVGEYVECRTCKDTYHTRVLEYDPKAISDQLEAEYKTAIKAVMVHILLADGIVDDDEVNTVISIYEKLGHQRLTVREVHEEIARVRNEHTPLSGYLRALQGRLNDEGKETVVTAALMVAVADGEFHDSEQRLMHQIGLDLGMTSAHIKGVISEFLSAGAEPVHL